MQFHARTVGELVPILLSLYTVKSPAVHCIVNTLGDLQIREKVLMNFICFPKRKYLNSALSKETQKLREDKLWVF